MSNKKKKLKEGAKFDTGKVRLELWSPDAEWGVGQVLTGGANKYDDRNWEKGILFSRVIGAIKRHRNAIERCEDIDPEWGLFHADHLMCEAMFLSHYFHNYEKYKKFDDRPKRVKKGKK